MEKIALDYSAPKTLKVKLRGDWLMSEHLPTVKDIVPQLPGHDDITQIAFDSSEVGKWDSGLVSFIFQFTREYGDKKVNVLLDGLPEGAKKLLALALKKDEETSPHEAGRELSFFEAAGERAIAAGRSALELVDFIGEIAGSMWRLFKGHARFRMGEFIYIVERCGASALGLISLISVLVGMILAFVGAVQLKVFGVQAYIADIVGIATVRVMGALMTAILMSGRTGASFAAELGLMQTNEEIDALKTLGLNPVEFLVMPRVLALTLMMPLLTLYADFMGILGGFIISVGMLNINPQEYITHTQGAVKLTNIWIGLIHSFVFGVIIALSGCFRGIKCERSASGVGEATTSAIVTAITGIVIATAIITFVCHILGV